MKTMFLTVLIVTCLTVSAETDPSRWNQLMGIITREIKILEVSKNKRPHLEFRLLELYTERLKLTMEKNNRDFLAASTTPGFSGKKDQYLRESQSLFQHAENYGLNLLRIYKDHPYHAEIAFTLGLNSRDYGRGKLTEKMLLESIQTSGMKPKRKYLAQAALAEYYFNEQRYTDAVKYYEIIVKDKKESWRAKHYYNLSWAYMKEKRFPEALKGMRMALMLSRRPGQIKIPEQSLLSLASFYTFVGYPLEGMKLFLTYTSDPVQFLFPLAKKSYEKGHSEETEIILKNVQHYIVKNNAWKHQEELYHIWLEYFRNYSRLDEHAQAADKLMTYYGKIENNKTLKIQMKKEAIEKFRSVAGFQQLKLSKDMKADQKIYQKKELAQVLGYYRHLIKLDPDNIGEYLYYQGETNYSVLKYKEAAEAYDGSIKNSYKKKDFKQVQKSLYSLLDLTSREKLTKEDNKKYLTEAYTLHVRLWPKDEKSRIIFPKLFQIFLEEKSDTKSAGVLVAFNKAFPQDIQHQQELMTMVLDQLIDARDTVKLSAWIAKFKGGFLSFDKQKLLKMEIALGNILFNQYQELASNGKKLEAAEGFQGISKNKLYSTKVRSQAAFLASMALLDIRQTKNSRIWMEVAIEGMTDADLRNYHNETVKIAERHYQLQDFESSYRLASLFLEKHCSAKDSTQKRLFEISIMTSLAENNTKGAEEIVQNFSRCLKGSKTREVALLQIYRSLEKHRRMEDLKRFVTEYNTPELQSHYRESLNELYWSAHAESDRAKILSEFKNIEHPQTLKWLREISLLKDADIKMKQLAGLTIWLQPQFDGEAFNKSLDQHLLQHQKFKEDYEGLLHSEQAGIVINGSLIFSQLYKNLGDKIISLRPAGMDPEIEKQFLPAMKELSTQFHAASANFDKELRENFLNGKGLNSQSRSIASFVEVDNPIHPEHSTLLMDKGNAQ